MFSFNVLRPQSKTQITSLAVFALLLAMLITTLQVRVAGATQASVHNTVASPLQVNQSLSSTGDWSSLGFDAAQSRYNSAETTLTTSNVGQLQQAWKTPIGANSSSAVVANNVLYAVTSTGLHALNASTGASLWTFPAANHLSTPSISNGIVYVGSVDHNVYALNASTGSKIWSFDTGATVNSSPTVVSGVVYIGSDNGNVYALNASTGSKIWSVLTNGGGTITPSGSVNTSPAVANGVVYIVSNNNTSGSLYALDASTGHTNWAYGLGNPVVAAPAVSNGVVYIVSTYYFGTFAFNAKTGAALWIYQTGYGSMAFAAVANGLMYISTDRRTLYALNATTASKTWTVAVSNDSSATVANGVVYVGSLDSKLYAYNATTGATLGSFATQGAISVAPTVANGVVYISSDDGNLYAFQVAGTN